MNTNVMYVHRKTSFEKLNPKTRIRWIIQETMDI